MWNYKIAPSSNDASQQHLNNIHSFENLFFVILRVLWFGKGTGPRVEEGYMSSAPGAWERAALVFSHRCSWLELSSIPGFSSKKCNWVTAHNLPLWTFVKARPQFEKNLLTQRTQSDSPSLQYIILMDDWFSMSWGGPPPQRAFLTGNRKKTRDFIGSDRWMALALGEATLPPSSLPAHSQHSTLCLRAFQWL